MARIDGLEARNSESRIVNKEQNFFERGAGKVIANIMEGTPEIQQMIAQGKFNEEQRFNLISDLVRAKTELPEAMMPYKNIFKAFGFTLDERYLNLQGFAEGTLPFYEKHAQTNSINLIMNGKSQKVIDASTAYIERVSEDEEPGVEKINFEEVLPTKFRKAKLQERLQKMKQLYGKSLMNVTQVGETPQDLEFQTVEPYRYVYDEENSRWLIFTYLGLEKIGKKTREIFLVVERIGTDVTELQEDKQPTIEYTEKKYECYIDEKLGIVKIGKEEIEGIHGYMCYEFVNDIIGKSDIEEIKHELLVYDMIETYFNIEIIATATTIHADARYFEGGQFNKNGLYAMYGEVANILNGDKPLFEVSQPDIRVEEYTSAKKHYLDIVCIDMGMSARALGFTDVNEQTATEALLDDEKTTETINSAKSDFKEQMELVIEDLYGGKYEFVLSEYRPQSITLRSKVANELGDAVSTEQKVQLIFPDMNKEQQMREIVLVKIENDKPLTEEELHFAVEKGLWHDEITATMIEENNVIVEDEDIFNETV